MKLLLDTNILNYLLKGQQQVIDRMDAAVERGDLFLLSPVVHYELTRYLDLKGAHRLMRAYERLTASWRRCDFGFEDWSAAARLWAERHRTGRAVSDFDLLLATLSLQEGAVIVTANVKHFEGFGLTIEDWTAPAKTS